MISGVPAARDLDIELGPTRGRVIVRPFVAGTSWSPDDPLVRRVVGLDEREVTSTLREVVEAFGDRHRDLDGVLDDHFAFVAHGSRELAALSVDRRRLIGAYYSQEHSIEAAALTNPSMVAAPDQSGLAPGAVRVVLSLRAIGEGHLSAIEFRSGVLGPTGVPVFDPVTSFATTGRHRALAIDKTDFCTKLTALDALDDVAVSVVGRLPERFDLHHLERAIAATAEPVAPPSVHAMHWLAKSTYELTFDAGTALSERVIFPWLDVESRGLEDARFVRFVDDDGSVAYFATYTAFDGTHVLPQLIETYDFTTFRVGTLAGACAANKGAAIFPRRIRGQYVALSRFDAESSYVMFSDDLRRWDTATLVESPDRPWGLARVGNCGSPIETDAGWLVITHQVGPFRVYRLGALLLDLDDPRRVIGRTERPLLAATDDRDGYVPNVVYSCGSMRHGGVLVLPYGLADSTCHVATVPIDALLAQLTG